MSKESLKELVKMYEEYVVQMRALMDTVQSTYAIEDIQKLNEVTGRVVVLHEVLVKALDKES